MRSTKDCLALLQRGDQNRIFASTEMNAHSSRSHAIVIVTVIKRRKRAITRNENGEEVTGQCALPPSLPPLSHFSLRPSALPGRVPITTPVGPSLADSFLQRLRPSSLARAQLKGASAKFQVAFRMEAGRDRVTGRTLAAGVDHQHWPHRPRSQLGWLWLCGSGCARVAQSMHIASTGRRCAL